MAGEGVMNLGRAFQYVGARSAMVSLWAVASESTNLLTEWMLEGMQSRKPKDEALLEARKRLRQAGYEHPFYWVPFILIRERDVLIAIWNTMYVSAERGALFVLLVIFGAVVLDVVAIWVARRRQWR